MWIIEPVTGSGRLLATAALAAAVVGFLLVRVHAVRYHGLRAELEGAQAARATARVPAPARAA